MSFRAHLPYLYPVHGILTHPANNGVPDTDDGGSSTGWIVGVLFLLLACATIAVIYVKKPKQDATEAQETPAVFNNAMYRQRDAG